MDKQQQSKAVNPTREITRELLNKWKALPKSEKVILVELSKHFRGLPVEYNVLQRLPYLVQTGVVTPVEGAEKYTTEDLIKVSKAALVLVKELPDSLTAKIEELRVTGGGTIYKPNRVGALGLLMVGSDGCAQLNGRLYYHGSLDRVYVGSTKTVIESFIDDAAKAEKDILLRFH